MEKAPILVKSLVYAIFEFAFYTWNKTRIITNFNKRSLFYLIVLLTGLNLVIYADFIEK